MTQAIESGPSTDACFAQEQSCDLNWPPAPQTIAETGLPRAVLEDLLIKTLHVVGATSVAHFAGAMGLSLPVISDLTERLARAGLLEILAPVEKSRASYSLHAHTYGLTERGLRRLDVALATNAYVGLAPIPLDQYAPLARLQSLRASPPTLAQLTA